MNTTIGELFISSTDGIGGLSSSVQDLLLRNALHPLNARITAGNVEGVSQEALLHTTGLMDINLDPNVTNISAQLLTQFRGLNFDILKGNSMLSYIMMQGIVFPDDNAISRTVFWIVWQIINFDVAKYAAGLSPYSRTLYLCTVQLSSDGLWDEMEIWYVDQTTGMPLQRLSNDFYPWKVFSLQVASTWSTNYRGSWGDEVIISPYSGQVELLYGNHIFSDDGKQEYGIFIGLNTQTLSEELRSQLTNPKDRLFLFFRSTAGHMLAASHGKFFSLSDVDFRYVNTVENPPNLSQYVFYTCLESTDALILESCKQLVTQYHNWSLIPESRQEMNLNGSRYWVAVGYSASSVSATMVLLKDRESIMGSIDASTAKATKDTDEKRRVAAIVFGVTTTVAAILPLAIGLWLGSRLLQLAKGMDCIAKLDFRGQSFPEARFQELHNFQQSFMKMERGMQAFGKFVPSAVVTRLVAGCIHTDDKMESVTVTVMFADIVSFSMMAETMAPMKLAEVCTEYFEVMCHCVLQCDGTVDKFIGDCIMAMWNAPLPRPNHERSAVTAALRMQRAVLSLHDSWRQCGLPILKFRLGIHTGHCLVGNFGCSYRVSYTCLGNNVNLASRLESLNKKFDTILCASQSTRDGCQNGFHFRYLSKVTVPGCSEVLAVYEVICSDEEQKEGRGRQTPHANGKARVNRSDSYLYREETSESTELCVVDDPSSATSSFCDRETSIPYHWGWRDRQAVLREAEEYEAAYIALVEGRFTECHRLVSGRLPDKAWQRLTAQLEHQVGNNELWDGVFHFREK
eukprot:GGOE01048313.1.p1 GENE.GGOE01048313.1~~GGOE01048313.1.p1  ORF type:complete len:827 (-),score=193.09 GGOE01048313.1:473-2866(-)